MTRNENGPLSDDRGEMKNNTPFAERDADAAVSGRVPANPELAAVQRALSHMKEALVMQPTPEAVSTHAAQFAAAVLPPTSAPEARHASPWRRRVSVAVALAVVSGLGVAGAAAADEAAPGDALYGIDQALERVHILDGGTPERLNEAGQLVERGDVDGAVELASDALENDGHGDAATGLRNAALAVASQSSGDDVRARVSEMLLWMAGEDSKGADFGAAVSERARQLSGNAHGNANANANANENANENATSDSPGKSGENGNVPDAPRENANENATTANGTGDGTPDANEDQKAHENASDYAGTVGQAGNRP